MFRRIDLSSPSLAPGIGEPYIGYKFQNEPTLANAPQVFMTEEVQSAYTSETHEAVQRADAIAAMVRVHRILRNLNLPTDVVSS